VRKGHINCAVAERQGVRPPCRGFVESGNGIGFEGCVEHVRRSREELEWVRVVEGHRRTGMVLKVGTHAGEVEDKRDPRRAEEGGWADAAALKDSWCVKSTGRNNDFCFGDYVEDTVVDPGENFQNRGAGLRTLGALRINHSDGLVVNKKVVVGSGQHVGIVTEPSM